MTGTGTPSTRELAGNAGELEATVVLSGESITFKPLTLRDDVAMEKALMLDGFGTLSLGLMTRAGVLQQLWMSARRGGYGGTREELGDLITTHNIHEAQAALRHVFPPDTVALAQRMRELVDNLNEVGMVELAGSVREGAEELEGGQSGEVDGGISEAIGAPCSGV